MASLEKISANLKLTELKKNSLRKSILMLMVEWKDLDEHLDNIQQSFEECYNELESREKHLFSIQDSVAESNKELDLIRKLIEERLREVECEEKDFRAFQVEQITDFSLKEKQFVSILKLVEEGMKEVELRKEKLDAQQKLVEGFFKKLKLEQKQFEPIQNSIGKRLKEISLKEKHFENRSKELHTVQNWIERRVKELDSKEEQVEECSKEIDLKEKHLDSIHKLTEVRCKELELKEKQLDSIQKSNEQRSEVLDLREKQLESAKKFIHTCFKEFQSKKKQFKSDQNLFEDCSKELESIEKEIDNRFREFQFKEKQIIHSPVESEQMRDIPADNLINCSSADVLVNMDGKSLQLFVNERAMDHDSIIDEVYKALQLSLDPAKLVLDAMEGFYPPHLKKGDMEFEGSVVQRSCLLLFEQLARISPQIQPHVQEEALILAGEWKVKMRKVAENSLEVLGFLHLLASYGLASTFDADELLSLSEIVVQHRQTPELYRLLGLKDNIPDIIQNLIKKKHYVMAVRFVFAFGLLDKFQPAPLLRQSFKHTKRIVKRIFKNGDKAPEEQNEAIDKRVAALRDVIKCIVDYKLESKYSPKIIEKYIDQLIMQKADKKYTISTTPRKTQQQQKSEKNHVSSMTPPVSTKALATAPVTPKAIFPNLSPATAMAVILANMDGKNLQFFLNEHLEDHELMRKEVSVALQMSFDSANLVLDAIQGFHTPHLKAGDKDFEVSVMSSCILLLEQLMTLSPQIKPWVKEAALKLAFDWKKKMKADTENPLEILGFLKLVGTYGLASSFDNNELLNLFENVAHHGDAYGLCQVLGFSEKIPASSILHPQVKIEQSSLENVQMNHTIASSCMGPCHDFNFLRANMNGKGKLHNSVCSKVPNFLYYVSDPAKLVLDALQGCYRSKLKENEKFNSRVKKSFFLLLEQLMRVSTEIKPHVKEEAMKFAVDWKARLLELTLKPSLEVLGFLQLLATYKLASSVDADELLDLLDIVHQHKQATDLSRVLGLAHKIPNFIQSLIQKEKHLQAIRYIFAFELHEKFPPVPLLKSHLSYSEDLAKKIRGRDKSSKALDRATNKEIAALKAVVKCIEDHGLELEYSPDNLKTRIDQLERQNEFLKISMLSAACEAHPQQQNTKKRPAPAHALSPKTRSQYWQAGKHPRIGLPLEESPSGQYSLGRPYGAPTGHYSLGGSTPVTPHMSHVAWQYSPDAATCSGHPQQQRPYFEWQYRPYFGASTGHPWHRP